MLVVEGIHTYYGPAHVLFGLSLKVERGEVRCLLGRNGVGKTTCLRTIMALTPARRGSVRFKDMEISRLAPFQIAREGIGYVPEDCRIFPDLTVQENLEIGQIRRKGVDAGWDLESAYNWFPQLKRFSDRLGGQLSGGERQMLTIARTLMGNPSLLLLDDAHSGAGYPICYEIG
jgi:branched-chain amino acid transport system ATP-binding protein